MQSQNQLSGAMRSTDGTPVHEPDDLRRLQLFFLAAAVFVVSAGYGALMPLLPAWLAQQMPDASPPEIAGMLVF